MCLRKDMLMKTPEGRADLIKAFVFSVNADEPLIEYSRVVWWYG